MIEVALITALTANSEVSALVGNRVFVMGSRQGSTYPYVTIQRISTVGAEHLNGPATLEWPRIQIDCWASPDDPTGAALKALTIADAIRTALDQQTITGTPTFTATFQDQRGPSADEETKTQRVGQDYLVFYAR